MKVVQASTPCQEEEIKKLIKQVYSEVFPIYFSDKEIQTYEKCNVLYMSTKHFERFSTLKEAYQIIASFIKMCPLWWSMTYIFLLNMSIFQNRKLEEMKD